MARLQLRDISNRLAESNGVDDVVSEFLGYLQAARPDWRAALIMYDAASETLTDHYTRERRRVVQNAMHRSVDELPVRLVRKFFRPSAFFNRTGHRGMIANLLQSSPAYEADEADRHRLAAIAPMPHWKSCICMPLHDRDAVLALLVVTSMNKSAFTPQDVTDLIPVKSMASLALAQQLLASGGAYSPGDDRLREANGELHTQIRHMQEHMARIEAEQQALLGQLDALTAERDALLERASQQRMEVARLKTELARRAGPESGPPSLPASEAALAESQRTVQFMREVFQVLSQEHRRESFAATLLTWYCENFGVERCSLMIFDEPSDSLRIAAFRGIHPEIARGVRVRRGDGIAGWVAHHRKPLFMRSREVEGPGAHTGQDNYNSDSYICVPLVYNGQLFGVLNLSNKTRGDVFDEIDLDRAMLTGSVLGMTLGSREAARSAAQAAEAGFAA